MTAVLPTLGTMALLAAGAAGTWSWVACLGLSRQSRETLSDRARHGLDIAVLGLLFASLILLVLLFTRAYRVEYVWAHVSNDLPALYVLSAFWAGQEGSFLLWALLAAVLGRVVSRTAGEWAVPVLRLYLPSVVILVILTLVSGLFRLLPQIPPDGAGLNPLLRDPWMAIHPPVTFLGYVILAIPFAYAFAAMDRERPEEWIAPALRWSLIGWLTLGAGIIMGGFWAYKVLGWGGWWGWDPVENASLLPWLMSLALVHGLLLQRSRSKLARSNVLLALLAFVLVIYSAYLTRSGVLAEASVHTFGASSVGTWLLLWLLAVLGYGLYRYSRAVGKLQSDELDEPFLSREVLLVVGLLVTVAIILLIGLGTSAPIISRLSGGEGAAVDISYYGRTTLPLGIFLALGIGLSVMLRWKGGREFSTVSLLAAVGVGGGATALALIAGIRPALHVCLAGSAAFALAVNLIGLGRTLAQSAPGRTGGYLSHAGAALMLIAIAAATTGRTGRADLIYRDPTRVLDYDLTFTGWIGLPDGKQAAEVELSRPGSPGRLILYPRLYRQFGSGQMMIRAEPHISRGPARDLYLAPIRYLPPAEALGALGRSFTLARGESRTVEGITFTFEEFDLGGHGPGGEGAGQVGARVAVTAGSGRGVIVPRSSPGGEAPPPADLPGDIGGQLRLQRIDADAGRIVLLYLAPGTGLDGRAEGGILSVELSEKPLMSILWAGVIMVLLGGLIAARRRSRESDNSTRRVRVP